jgi:hypothetical protein
MALTIIIVLGILQVRLRDSKAAFGPGHPPASYFQVHNWKIEIR